jgi:uncharacterized cysteine cluster protein YcgN (CxxCxxCC family)
MSESRDTEFWKMTPLAEMTAAQWESLCDGCGRCCLHKLQDAYTDRIYYTSIACRLLDADRCRCRRYSDRQQLVDDCVVLTPAQIGNLGWLPPTCAYRLLDEGKPLPDWHPLVSGDPASVHRAGMSVRGRVIGEDGIHEDDYENFVIDWIPVVQIDHD